MWGCLTYEEIFSALPPTPSAPTLARPSARPQARDIAQARDTVRTSRASSPRRRAAPGLPGVSGFDTISCGFPPTPRGVVIGGGTGKPDVSRVYTSRALRLRACDPPT